MDKGKNELTVVTRAKDLCSYIMTVTQKCPKNFKYTYVSRLQNLAMDVIENIFRATDCQNLLGAWIISDKRRFGF